MGEKEITLGKIWVRSQSCPWRALTSMIHGRRRPQDRHRIQNIPEGLHFPGTQGMNEIFQKDLKEDRGGEKDN